MKIAVTKNILKEGGETYCEQPYITCHCRLGKKQRINVHAKFNVFAKKQDRTDSLKLRLAQPLLKRVWPYPVKGIVQLRPRHSSAR